MINDDRTTKLKTPQAQEPWDFRVTKLLLTPYASLINILGSVSSDWHWCRTYTQSKQCKEMWELIGAGILTDYRFSLLQIAIRKHIKEQHERLRKLKTTL